MSDAPRIDFSTTDRTALVTVGGAQIIVDLHEPAWSPRPVEHAWRRYLALVQAGLAIAALIGGELLDDRETGQALAFALALGVALIMSIPPVAKWKEVEVASQIRDYPHSVGNMLTGDIIVLAPRPTSSVRAAERYAAAYIVARTGLERSDLHVVVSLATGEQLALPSDRACVRVRARLTVEVES